MCTVRFVLEMYQFVQPLKYTLYPLWSIYERAYINNIVIHDIFAQWLIIRAIDYTHFCVNVIVMDTTTALSNTYLFLTGSFDKLFEK